LTVVSDSAAAVVFFRLLLALALVAITWLAVIPEPPTEGLAISDKLQHALAFVVLLGLADHAWPASGITLTKVAWLLAYGAGIEILQFYIPYRDCSVLDLLADGTGMLVYPLTLPLQQYLPFPLRRRRST
jgi:VanZ family protein